MICPDAEHAGIAREGKTVLSFRFFLRDSGSFTLRRAIW